MRIESDILEANVRLGITWSHSNRDPHDFFELTITDEGSGCQVFCVSLTAEQVGLLVGSSREIGQLPATFRSLDRIGMVREHRDVVLEISNAKNHTPGDDFMALVREALEPYLAEGWTAFDSDLRQFNGHRYGRKGDKASYRIGLTRFIPRDSSGEA